MSSIELAPQAAAPSRPHPRPLPPAARPPSRPGSDAVAWRLLDMAYADPIPQWAYLVLVIVVGGLALGCMRDVWAAGWACSGICLAAAALVDFYGHPARRTAGRLRSAQRRFMIMSALHGAYWGLANLVLLLSNDTFLQFWVINAETGMLGLTVARLNPMASAIKLETAICMISLVLCCLLCGNVYLQGYAVLTVLYLVSMFAVIRDLNQQTVRLLVTEEENAAMLQSEAETNARLDAANRRLEAMAKTDGLTGIPNRRYFDEAIRSEWSRAVRAGTRLSVLLIDIDNFKSYNDTFGHLAGDACLRQVAGSLAGALRRPSDLAARYGGEEFVVIIAGADGFGTVDVAERLRAAVERMALPSPSGGPVTVSIGASFRGSASEPAPADEDAAALGIRALIADADAHLYEAKRAGRNCVRARLAQQTGRSPRLEDVPLAGG